MTLDDFIEGLLQLQKMDDYIATSIFLTLLLMK